MILVTGGTGFIGKVLIRHLVDLGYPIRTLIRPSPKTPNLPLGVPIEAVVSNLEDTGSLRAAMSGVDTIFHLAGAEWQGPRVTLMQTDIRGTRAVLEAASEAGVKRIFYVSHLGADRASAYPVQKAKAIAEEFIRQSPIQHTIIRSAIVFGPEDGLTTGIARILGSMPFVFLVPGDGKVLLQPVWVEDLATCLIWSMDNSETRNRTIEIGGPEYLQFNQIVEIVMREIGLKRRILSLSPPLMRGLTILLESIFPTFPTSTFWLDYLAVNRTTALDTMPRVFNIMPTRLSYELGYLQEVNWRRVMLRSLFRRA